MIEIHFHTTQDIELLKELELKYHIGTINEREENNYWIVCDADVWVELHGVLSEGSLEVQGIWNKQGQIVTDKNVNFRNPENLKKKKDKSSKFTKVKYKKRFKQLIEVDEDENETFVDAPDDMPIGKIFGWDNRDITEDEI